MERVYSISGIILRQQNEIGSYFRDVRQFSKLVKYFFNKFLFFSILSHKIIFCQIFNLFKKIIKNNVSFKKSPGSAAFVIYISNAPGKGATTIFHIADNYATHYFIQLTVMYRNVVAQYEK